MSVRVYIQGWVTFLSNSCVTSFVSGFSGDQRFEYRSDDASRIYRTKAKRTVWTCIVYSNNIHQLNYYKCLYPYALHHPERFQNETLPPWSKRRFVYSRSIDVPSFRGYHKAERWTIQKYVQIVCLYMFQQISFHFYTLHWRIVWICFLSIEDLSFIRE